MLMAPRFRRLLLPLLSLTLAAGCSGDETAPDDDHDPVRVVLLTDGQEQAAPILFASGATVRVRLKFYNADDEDLDDIESDHFARIVFQPAILATVAPVAGHHFQFDVTGGGTLGTGTVTVGFGHDAAADEHEFSGIEVRTVAVASAPR